ncbi:MAG: hypothetical protein NW206_04885 [Hyphomonadaceae bacterium]|nr:hypothetical protein [Hyphomonadaceae bacterium]
MAFDANDLSPHEQYVVDRIRNGEIADFSSMQGPDGRKPAVRAGFLRRLMLELEPDWAVRTPGVRLKGVQIDGALDLTDCSGAGGAGLAALALEQCDIPEPMDLSHAWLSRLNLSGSAFTHLRAHGLKLDGPLEFSGAHPFTDGGVCWIDARSAMIGGRVDGANAKLRLPEDLGEDGGAQLYALNLREANIGNGICLRPDFYAIGGLSLFDAVVEGLVDLRGAQIKRVDRRAINLGNLRASGVVSLNRGFQCDGPIWMRGAKLAGGFNADGATITISDGESEGIQAENAEIGENLQLRNKFRCNAPVSFAGAIIRGSVDINKGAFAASGVALDFRRAVIEAELIGAASIKGALGVAGANIGRNLDLRGSEIVAEHKKNGAAPKSQFAIAIDGANVRIGGAALLQGANIKGEVFLADARIEGYASFGGGRFLNGGGWAIRAPNMRVGGNLTLKIDDASFAPHGLKTVIEGAAKFDRAQVDGAVAWASLELRGPSPEGAKGGLLSFRDASISGSLQARALTAQQEACVDLSGASCAALDDDLKNGWGVEKCVLGLEGFTYQRLDGDDRWRGRLAWLKRARRDGKLFSPQPYTTLAQVYARAGKREDARRVLLALHDQRTLIASAGPLTWTLSSAFGLIAGYGFAPIRAARALLLFLALGVIGVFAMNAQGALVRPDGAACNGAIEPALYAIDVALPVIDLGQETRCAPGRTARADLPAGVALGDSDWRLFEGAALWKWAQALYAILGAILTALAIITFSGMMKPKDD